MPKKDPYREYGRSYDRKGKNLARRIDEAGIEIDGDLHAFEQHVDNIGRNIDRKLANLGDSFPGQPSVRRLRAREPHFPIDERDYAEDDQPYYAVDEWRPSNREGYKTPYYSNRFLGDEHLAVKIIGSFLLMGILFAWVGWITSFLLVFFQFGVLMIGMGGVGVLWHFKSSFRNHEHTAVGLQQSTGNNSVPTTIITEREVVKVPCQYCGSLTDPYKRCASCGGKPL